MSSYIYIWEYKLLTYQSRKSLLPSWIWISSSTTRRNADKWGIFGDEHVECVRLGNQVAARWALLALVCTIMNIFWVVPEPHRENLSEGIYNQLYDVINLFFILLDPTAGVFPRVVSRSMGVLQNGLLLKRLADSLEVEQPQSSCLRDCPYVSHVLLNLGPPAFFRRMWMATFGHWCPKPTQLFGTWHFSCIEAA